MSMKLKIKSRKIKILLITLPLLAVIVAGLILTKKILSASSLSSTTYTVKSETYENVIEIAGTVSAAQEQTLQALSDGTVVEVYVKQGDSVKKGDIIIQLDDSTQKYNLAKHDYDMQTTLISGSLREYQLMKTVAVGDSLEAKDSVGTLVDISYLTAAVEVAETDVEKLSVGQKVEFTFSAYSGTVEGYVTGWPAIGKITDRGATVVKAEVRIDDYPESILPNFSFSGKIKISPDENYLIVERYAVGRENGQAYVVLASTDQKVYVTVSPYGKEYVKIESGLSGGEVLRAQSAAGKSGSNKRNGPAAMGAGPAGGGMAGGPPPGF